MCVCGGGYLNLPKLFYLTVNMQLLIFSSVRLSVCIHLIIVITSLIETCISVNHLVKLCIQSSASGSARSCSRSLINLNYSRNKMWLSETEQEQTNSANKTALYSVHSSLLHPLTNRRQTLEWLRLEVWLLSNLVKPQDAEDRQFCT